MKGTMAWMMGSAAIIFGAYVGKQLLGLLFDVTRLFPWGG